MWNSWIDLGWVDLSVALDHTYYHVRYLLKLNKIGKNDWPLLWMISFSFGNDDKCSPSTVLYGVLGFSRTSGMTCTKSCKCQIPTSRNHWDMHGFLYTTRVGFCIYFLIQFWAGLLSKCPIDTIKTNKELWDTCQCRHWVNTNMWVHASVDLPSKTASSQLFVYLSILDIVCHIFVLLSFHLYHHGKYFSTFGLVLTKKAGRCPSMQSLFSWCWLITSRVSFWKHTNQIAKVRLCNCSHTQIRSFNIWNTTWPLSPAYMAYCPWPSGFSCQRSCVRAVSQASYASSIIPYQCDCCKRKSISKFKRQVPGLPDTASML